MSYELFFRNGDVLARLRCIIVFIFYSFVFIFFSLLTTFFSSLSISSRIITLVAIILASGWRVSAENANLADDASRSVEIFTFAELLKKAEYIVVADVGATNENASSLIIRQIVKAPKKDPKQVDSEMLKRAAALLADDKTPLPPAPPAAPTTIKAIVKDLIKLPPPGTQAVFFLWDKIVSVDEPQAFQIAHPQCIYDIEFLPQIQIGVARPRSIAAGCYLRDWDRQMAEQAKEHERDKALLNAKGGEVIMGLRIKALHPIFSARGDNSFSVLAVIENTRARQQMIYDGPISNFGVILRPKDSDVSKSAPLVLRQSIKHLTANADNSVLSLPDPTDFALVIGEGSFSKDIFFDSKEFPVLKKLQGDYMLSVFYVSARDGKDVELESPAWTGMLISEELPFKIIKRSNQ